MGKKAVRTRRSFSDEGVCAFGQWQGTIRFEGEETKVRDLVGWAEEVAHLW